MPSILVASVALIVVFSILEMFLHSRRLIAWLALSYFFILGFGMGAGAFGTVNFWLAGGTRSKEAQGWFEVFATIGITASVLAIILTIGMTVALRNHLYMYKVSGGAAILFFLMCGLFIIGAASSNFNWW